MAERLVGSEANGRRIAYVEQCFGSSGQPLCQPKRVLVGEGVLTKMCRKKSKPRQFFLFNDILVYGNIVINKKKYNKQFIIPLENVRLQNIDDTPELVNAWQIISPHKSFTVYAATNNEKVEWMTHIVKCVQELHTKHGKQRTDAEDSPVWVPDSHTRICMHCKKSEFNLVNRRHHCRRCGNVVCGGCSTKKWLFPQQSSNRLRVCDSCYAQLSTGEMDPSQDVADANVSSSSDDSDCDEPERSNDQPTFYETKKDKDLV